MVQMLAERLVGDLSSRARASAKARVWRVGQASTNCACAPAGAKSVYDRQAVQPSMEDL